MHIPKHRKRIEKVFTADNVLKYVEFAIKAATNSLQFEEVPNYADAMMLQRYTAVFGHLAYSLGEYQTDDHPVIQIYEKRLNTINRYVKRGTLDDDLAEVMKKLAKDKILRAKSDVTYAKGTYEKEMEQAALRRKEVRYAPFPHGRRKMVSVLSDQLQNGALHAVRLSDWDTMITNRCTNRAIAYLLNSENEKLPKEIMVAFEL